MLLKDFSTIPGIDLGWEVTQYGSKVFEDPKNPSIRLTVTMANRLPLERQTGAGLIYFNEACRSGSITGSIVMPTKSRSYFCGSSGNRVGDFGVFARGKHAREHLQTQIFLIAQPVTTKVVLRQVARAIGEKLKRPVGVLDEHVELPSYQVGEADPESPESPESIERAEEKFMSLFGLGMGPMSNVTRIAENADALVMKVQGLVS